MIKDSIIFGRNVAKTAHLAQKRIFLRDFTPMIFMYLLHPIVPQNMKKKILRKDPEM